MTFGAVLEGFRQNKRYALPEWAKTDFIGLQSPDNESKMTKPYIFKRDSTGIRPWVPTHEELLTNNWNVV